VFYTFIDNGTPPVTTAEWNPFSSIETCVAPASGIIPTLTLPAARALIHQVRQKDGARTEASHLSTPNDTLPWNDVVGDHSCEARSRQLDP
jgi:hypothetical protein